jgi:hypothetical protein
MDTHRKNVGRLRGEFIYEITLRVRLDFPAGRFGLKILPVEIRGREFRI